MSVHDICRLSPFIIDWAPRAGLGGRACTIHRSPPFSRPTIPPKTINREVVEFIEEERGVRVAPPDEARFMVYTPPQLQRTDLKDLVIVQPEVSIVFFG